MAQFVHFLFLLSIKLCRRMTIVQNHTKQSGTLLNIIRANIPHMFQFIQIITKIKLAWFGLVPTIKPKFTTSEEIDYHGNKAFSLSMILKQKANSETVQIVLKRCSELYLFYSNFISSLYHEAG